MLSLKTAVQQQIRSASYYFSTIGALGTAPYRTASAAELGENKFNEGETVRVAGWMMHRRKMKGGVFISLRDPTGAIQLKTEAPEILSKLSGVGLESVLSVEGVLESRPESEIRGDDVSGKWEISINDVSILSTASELPWSPFEIGRGGDGELGEESRLEARFVDLRSDKLQRNLALRSKLGMRARSVLVDAGFLEVETPTLFRSSPEGAREFVVPTRGKPDAFYALTQSPQQWKQMLMVGGVERYFQFARCYRDESGRADRQPEFTQLDLEAAWVSMDDVMGIVESVVKAVWDEAGSPLGSEPVPILTWDTVMTNYGVDKPDLRVPWAISDLSETSACKLGSNARALAIPGLGSSMSGAALKRFWTTVEKEDVLDGVRMAMVKVKSVHSGEWASPLTKLLSEEERVEIGHAGGWKDGDVVALATGGSRLDVLTSLGRWRKRGIEAVGVDRKTFAPLWVVDFPLFEVDEATGEIIGSMHHPFTAVAPEDAGKIESDPKSVHGQHYDFVMNGVELGGGSIRIHNAEQQQWVFDAVLKLSSERQAGFKALMKALKSGAPPHGGFALGWDRVCAVVAGEENIREVIAFPKSAGGRDLLTGAPASVVKEDLDEYHVSVVHGKE